MHILKKYLPFLLGVCFFAACKEEQVPAYLRVESISVVPRSYEGSASSNISDVWVYQNSNLQGAYELPAEFPILAEGNTRLIVFAGIKLNGISATRYPYPFYDVDTVDVTLVPAQVATASPTVRYSSNAEFDFIEDFENANNFDHMQRTSGADVFEGGYSGQFIIDSDNEVVSNTNSEYVIPYSTTAVFLEMDYKNNHKFEVGITGIFGTESVPVYKLTVPPRSEWNKLYVNFTPEVNGMQADEYLIYFRVVPSTDLNAIRIFFDNVKLIHAKV